MTLIVEDGTGLPNAESYASVDETDTYMTSRGMSLWSNLITEEKEQALRRATDFMIQRYRTGWMGRRRLTTQYLDWPRVGVTIEEFQNGYGVSYGLFQVPYDTVPKEIKNACMELALRASIDTLSEDLSTRVLQETVGPITMKYDPFGPQGTRYVQVDSILKPFLMVSSGGAMVKLYRS